jgi:hypothetical protein
MSFIADLDCTRDSACAPGEMRSSREGKPSVRRRSRLESSSVGHFATGKRGLSVSIISKVCVKARVDFRLLVARELNYVKSADP